MLLKQSLKYVYIIYMCYKIYVLIISNKEIEYAPTN